MKKIYKSFKCEYCYSEFILINLDISKNEKKNRYFTCR